MLTYDPEVDMASKVIAKQMTRQASRRGGNDTLATAQQPSASGVPSEQAIPANAFGALVQQCASDRHAAIDAIRGGLPAALLKDAGAYFNVPMKRIRSIVRVPEKTAAALVKRGACLDASASERLWRLADVVTIAQDVFEERHAACAWMRTAHRTFADVAPMDLLDTEPGATAVRQVLSAIATGGAT